MITATQLGFERAEAERAVTALRAPDFLRVAMGCVWGGSSWLCIKIVV
jgi:hypothetical protein